MPVVAFHEDRVMFCVNVPKDINALLQRAVAAYDDTPLAESLLWEAQQLDPKQLEVYVALYKFYFYKNRIGEAEQVVLKSLQQSAEQGGFSEDWNELTPSSTDWFNTANPQRLHLYAMKALSFIRLRQADVDGAEKVLAKLRELDPTDQVGGSVLDQLATAMREDA
jgi:tetratricopeptide (TPR) repeat protein